MGGYVFRSRRMIRGMGHMLFPRYIQREARDFFYLTSRVILPGAPIAAGASAALDEGVWRTKGLPQHGFPYAVATTWVHSEVRAGLKLRVVRADPRTMAPAGTRGTEAEAPTVLALSASPRGALQLWWASGVFSIGAAPPTRDATSLAGGAPASAAPAATARAAVGVQDEDGMLVWVELPPEVRPDAQTASAMDALLEQLGCATRMAVPGEARALLGGSLDVTGAPVAVAALPSSPSRLIRAHAPDAHAIFPDTPIVPVPVWQPLQAKRVRYFYKPPPAASSASSGAVAPSSPAAPGTPAPATSEGGKTPIRVQSPR
jgi:hypothetical protein